MEWYVVGSGLLALLVFFIVIGLPIPFALAAASLPFLWSIVNWSTSLSSVELMLWGAWVNYILIAVPLFVFLGELVGRSQIGPRLYDLMHRGLRVPGSAAYGSVAASAGFGAISGSSMVGALTIGGVALPQMLRLGYGRRLAAGSLAAGGTLSVLIPPSLILLFYGILTDTSIGKLFIGGAIPGLGLALMFTIVVFFWQRFRPEDLPGADQGGRLAALEIAISLLPVLIIGTVIIVSIYGGIATPTEAAAVACVITIVLAFWIGELTLRGFVDAMLGTMRTMGYLGLLLSAALLFGFVLNTYRIPQEFTALFVSLDLPAIAVLLIVIGIYLLLGMFLEPTAISFVTLPTMFPIVAAMGYDPIWFGIIFTVTMEIAVLTPPMGLNLYVIQGIAPKEVNVSDVVYGSLPFIAAQCVLIVLLLLFPQIALWLPSTM